MQWALEQDTPKKDDDFGPRGVFALSKQWEKDFKAHRNKVPMFQIIHDHANSCSVLDIDEEAYLNDVSKALQSTPQQDAHDNPNDGLPCQFNHF